MSDILGQSRRKLYDPVQLLVHPTEALIKELSEIFCHSAGILASTTRHNQTLPCNPAQKNLSGRALRSELRHSVLRLCAL
jgi:hypothetical protein